METPPHFWQYQEMAIEQALYRGLTESLERISKTPLAIAALRGIIAKPSDEGAARKGSGIVGERRAGAGRGSWKGNFLKKVLDSEAAGE